VVLDESHLVPPFERLLEQIAERGEFGPKGEGAGGGEDATVVAVREGEPKPKKADAPTDEERRAMIAWPAFEAVAVP